MKALIVRPDGTTFLAEGTPEEIAKLAREAGLGAEPRQSPEVLDELLEPLRMRPRNCNCPAGDPSYRGGPIWWGGYCPAHSMRVGVTKASFGVSS